MPWLTLWALYQLRRWWSETLVILLALPVVLLTLFLILASVPLPFEQFSEARWGSTSVRLFRIDDGVVARQEMTILPGIRMVRTLGRYSSCAVLDAVPETNGVRLVRKPECHCPGMGGDERKIPLKRFVYF